MNSARKSDRATSNLTHKVKVGTEMDEIIALAPTLVEDLIIAVNVAETTITEIDGQFFTLVLSIQHFIA